MFERFTDRARRVLVLAQEEAKGLHHNYIGTEHILLGLVHEGDGIAAKALESLGVTIDSLREEVVKLSEPSSGPTPNSPAFTVSAKKVLEYSLREALQLGHNYIGTEHMLLGLVREGEGTGSKVLMNLGIDLARVRSQVMQIVSSYEDREESAVGANERMRPKVMPGFSSYRGNLSSRRGCLTALFGRFGRP